MSVTYTLQNRNVVPGADPGTRLVLIRTAEQDPVTPGGPMRIHADGYIDLRTRMKVRMPGPV